MEAIGLRGSRSCAPTQATPPPQHRHRGDRPDEQLEPAGIGEVRQVASAPVGRAEPKGDAERGQDRGDHDRSIIPRESNRISRSAEAIGSFRIENAFGAAAKRRGAE